MAQNKIRSQRPRYDQVAFFPRHNMNHSLFVAVQNYDWSGYDYLRTAIESGAAAVVLEVSQQHLVGLIPDTVDVYLVEDSRQFLSELAQQARQNFSGDVIAITGSTGKSQTALWLHHALSAHFKVQFNADNRNSFFGVCDLLLNLHRDTEKLIVELGARQAGEMKLLGELVQPQTVLITNIQLSHLKYLKNIQNVLQLKTELFSIPSVEDIFLNAADPLQSPLPSRFPDKSFHLYRPVEASADLSLSGLLPAPHFYQIIGAVRALIDFFDAEPAPPLERWPQLPLSLQLRNSKLSAQTLIDGRTTTPESVENFRKTLLAVLSQVQPKTSFALLSGIVDTDPTHELAFVKTAARLWAEVPLTVLCYVGAHADTFEKIYHESLGQADLVLADKDAKKISELLKNLPTSTLLALQGHQETWFLELAAAFT